MLQEDTVGGVWIVTAEQTCSTCQHNDIQYPHLKALHLIFVFLFVYKKYKACEFLIVSSGPTLKAFCCCFTHYPIVTPKALLEELN